MNKPSFYLFTLLLAVRQGALASNHTAHIKRAHGVSWSPWDANGQTFDYVVVGGGLTGITIASRLSEDPSTTVLIIEAGYDDRTNDLTQNIYRYGEVFSSWMNWGWPADHGRGITGGKTLGGGSSINGAAWTRGMDAQYNAWGQLLEGSEAYLNWNWESLFSYMKKAENWSPPNDVQRSKGADSIDEYHGFSGPVQVTFPSPDSMYGGPQQPSFMAAIQTLTGINKCRDLNGGNPNCVAVTPLNLNWRDQDHRSTAATAYLSPVESTRSNWITLVNHQVTTINWSATPDANGNKIATGVQFKQADNTGQLFTAMARKEVILAAGAINTPHLLQLSGVGDSAVLNGLGIPTVIHAPTVGKNMQEQTMSSLGSGGNGFDLGGRGPSNSIAFPNIYQVYGAQATSAVNKILGNINAWAQSLASSALDANALKYIFNIQADLIINKNAPIVEMFYDTGYPDIIGVDMWNLLPFSRGTVQINSRDPFQKPTIHINPFVADIDMDNQVAGSRLVRRLFQQNPLSALSTGETVPGFRRIPDSPEAGSYQDWMGWIWDNFNAVSHPIGTCAMMKKSLGGVVDGKLRLYGAANVRITDASVMPMQISGHLSSTLYGIAEKLADMIKNNV